MAWCGGFGPPRFWLRIKVVVMRGGVGKKGEERGEEGTSEGLVGSVGRRGVRGVLQQRRRENISTEGKGSLGRSVIYA